MRSETSTETAPRELIEIDPPRVRAGKLVAIVLSFVFIIVVASTASALWVMPAIKGAPLGVTVIVATILASTGGMILLMRRVRKKAVGSVRSFIAEHPQLDGGALVLGSMKRQGAIGSFWEPREFLRSAALHGQKGWTVRVSSPKGRRPIEPIAVPFEPRALNDAEASFEEFESALNADTVDLRDEARQRKLAKRRLRKFFIYGGGSLIGIVPQIVIAAIDSWRRGRATAMLIVWTGLLALAIVLVLTMRSLKLVQWYIAPGCLALRGRKGLRLYDHRDSIMIVTLRAKGMGTIAVANESAVDMRGVTRDEADIALRAWLSPVPPPSLERLSDLA